MRTEHEFGRNSLSFLLHSTESSILQQLWSNFFLKSDLGGHMCDPGNDKGTFS